MVTFNSFKLVWKEACGRFDDMIEAEGWKDKASVDLVPVNDITTKVTYTAAPDTDFSDMLACSSH